jgi:ADP-ribosylglycohydrolase
VLESKMELTNLQKWINRTTWMDGCEVDAEYRQAREEGRLLDSVESEFARLIAVPKPWASWYSPVGGERDEQWLQEVQALVDRVQTLPIRPDFPYREPNDLEGIHAARPPQGSLPAWSGCGSLWQEKLHGGLLGRICGCMLGKPVEGWDRASIRASAEVTGNWPISDYLRRPSEEEAARMDSKFRRFVCPDSMLKNGIDGMVEDDDINYTTIGFAIVQKFGADFTPLDVAAYWCGNVPILHTCTAERVAYRNFVSNVLPPDSATHRNPYREWIGAQIRADYFGYANPGDPERAADWAWRDASISHVRNGIYGEMWAAAMLAAAYLDLDWEAVIQAGLTQIPARCRLREDIERILTAHREGLDYGAAVEVIHSQWDETHHHDWCHTDSNAQVVAAALLYGEDDYETTITRAVMPGFDTDCNAATCGSLWGVRHGVSALPKKWTSPMRDLVRTGVAGYHEVKISKLAEDMFALAQSFSPRET